MGSGMGLGLGLGPGLGFAIQRSARLASLLGYAYYLLLTTHYVPRVAPPLRLLLTAYYSQCTSRHSSATLTTYCLLLTMYLASLLGHSALLNLQRQPAVCIGALVHWRIGALVHWCIGALVHWCIGALVHRRIGALGHCGVEGALRVHSRACGEVPTHIAPRGQPCSRPAWRGLGSGLGLG